MTMTTTTPTALRERFETALSIVDEHAEVVEFVGDPDAMQTVADALGDAIDLVAHRAALRNVLKGWLAIFEREGAYASPLVKTAIAETRAVLAKTE